GIAAEWLSKSWRPGFDLLADCILAPALAPGELVREKRLLLHDQTAQDDNPTQVAFRLFSEALYGTHPYARDVLGTPASVGALDRALLSGSYRERYPVSALTLAIVGDVDVDDVIERVKRRFAAVKQ